MSAPRSAVITGGASGIGLATAVLLNAAGFDVTIVGRDAQRLATASAEITARGGGLPVTVQAADLASPERCTGIIDDHAARCGGIDALVASAGAWELVNALDIDPRSWDATMDVHLRGAVLSASAAARHMTRAGRGRIVLLSSVNGFHSDPGSVAYNAAKTAIVSVARSFAVDLGGSGVTVNAVAPGWVDTPMTREDLAATTPERLRRLNTLGRAGDPDEIARVIRFLVIDAPDFLTGSTLVVDGGQTALAPMP